MSRLSSLRSLTMHEDPSPSMNDVVAYDTEASDVDIWHGQILQFSCVKANDDLQEIEATDLHVRLLPYVVPAPEALRVTGLDVASLDSNLRISEYEAAAGIERILKPSHGGMRTYLTFNGLRFDDGIIRTTLFRNLRYPYVTSGRQSRRVDLLPLVQFLGNAAPELITTSIVDGKRSWKLETLCEANGIPIKAHDGLEDARATLALGRMIKERAPWAWNLALRNGQPAAVSRHLSTAFRERKAVWHFEHFGEPDIAPCAVLGTDNKGKWVLVDLRSDTDPASVDLSDVKSRSLDGIRIIRANSMPMLIEFEDARRFGRVMSASHADLQAEKLLARDWRHLLKNFCEIGFEDEEDTSSEKRLYESFPSNADKSHMEKFHRTADWDKRAEIVFADERLSDFASRLVAMNTSRDDLFGPDALSPLGQAISRFENGVMRRPYADKGMPWQTLEGAAESADESWLQWARTHWPDADLTTRMSL